jgi:hypothetical protein
LPQAKQREEFGAAAFKFNFADLAKVRSTSVEHGGRGALIARRDASRSLAASLLFVI